MQILDNEKLDSIETDEELSIQFSGIPRDFSMNMAFTLLIMFKVKEG